MTRHLALVALLMLAACGEKVVPVTVKWPEAPPSLMKEPADLIPVTATKPQLSDILENANQNYSQYRVLQRQIKDWQDWYAQQKSIFESVQ